jgi:hypothetical protein
MRMLWSRKRNLVPNRLLAGQPATRATHMLAAVVGNAGPMLMHADDGLIDHLYCRIIDADAQRVRFRG